MGADFRSSRDLNKKERCAVPSVLKRVAVVLAPGRRPHPDAAPQTEEPDPPADPYAWKTARLTRRPKGRSGSAAVIEPDDE